MIPYNPCGAIVDWGRFRYRTACRFFHDSTREDVIIWYPANPNAVALPFESAIHQLAWNRDPDDWYWGDEDVGEVPNAPKVISHRGPIPGAWGQHQCGTRADFESGATFDPDANYPQRPDGLPACCPGGIGGIAWGGRMPMIPPGGGMEWGGRMTRVIFAPGAAPPTVVPHDEPLWGILLGGGNSSSVQTAQTLDAGSYHYTYQASRTGPIYFGNWFVIDSVGAVVNTGGIGGDSGCIDINVPVDDCRITVTLSWFASPPPSPGWYFTIAHGTC